MIRSIAKEEEIHDNQEAKHLSIESPNHWQVLYVQHLEKIYSKAILILQFNKISSMVRVLLRL